MLKNLVVFAYAGGDENDVLGKEMGRWAERSAQKWRPSVEVEICPRVDKHTIQSALSPDKNIWVIACWSHGRPEDGALLSAKGNPYIDQINCGLLARRRTVALCCHSYKLLNHVRQRCHPEEFNLSLGFTREFLVVLNRSSIAYEGFEDSCSAALDEMIASGDAALGKDKFRKAARRFGWLALVRFAWYRVRGDTRLSGSHFKCMLAHAHNGWISECC